MRFTLPQPEDTTTTRSALRLQIVLTVFAKGALQTLEGLHGVLTSVVSGNQENGAICLASSAITYFNPYLIPLTGRVAKQLADSVECGDGGGICSSIMTPLNIALAAANIITKNVIDVYDFISSVTGSARSNIQGANLRVALGTLVIGLGAGTALM